MTSFKRTTREIIREWKVFAALGVSLTVGGIFLWLFTDTDTQFGFILGIASAIALYWAGKQFYEPEPPESPMARAWREYMLDDPEMTEIKRIQEDESLSPSKRAEAVKRFLYINYGEDD